MLDDAFQQSTRAHLTTAAVIRRAVTLPAPSPVNAPPASLCPPTAELASLFVSNSSSSSSSSSSLSPSSYYFICSNTAKQEDADFDAQVSTWMPSPRRRPAVTLTFDL